MSRRPFVKQFLSQRHRQQYFQAKEHQRSRRQQLIPTFVYFRRVGMSYADGQLYILRRRNERYDDCCVMEIDYWEEKV